jgi:outer membrane protein
MPKPNFKVARSFVMPRASPVAFAILLATAAATLSSRAARGQAPNPTGSLSLPAALALALDSNPSLQQTRTSLRSSDVAIRTAKGAFLPTLSASFGTSFQQGGRQVLSGAELGASSDVIQSSYSIGISYRLSALAFLNPRIQRANQDAVRADIDGSVASLRATITQQYLSVLQSEARAELQDSLIISAQLQLDFARARVSVGAGIPLDAQRAEVSLGQILVAQIQARNQLSIDKLRLFQSMGVMLPLATELTTNFELAPIALALDSLLAIARARNPGLVALRAREVANEHGVKHARAEYLPSLSLGTGFGGFTYQYRDQNFLVQRGQATTASQRASCFTTDSLRLGAGLPGIAAQCQQLVFTDSDAARIRAGNRQYPLDFTRNPLSLSASISLPIFDGFAREQRVAEAELTLDNSRHAARALELALTADITAAYLTVESSLRAARLQDQNASKARQELQLLLERYRVGSATFVEVADSRSLFESAESAGINAVYDFHKAVAVLEAAVGLPIR